METKAQINNNENSGSYYPPAQPAQHYPYQTAPQQPQRPLPYPVDPQYPSHPEPVGGCCRNGPQFLSVGAAACIIFTGGMSMAWGLEFNTWSRVNDTKYMNVCWFAMAIVGALFSAILSNLRKKVLMFLSSVLVMIGGVLFLSLYNNFGAIMAARHINGFAVGWILVTTFVIAGEEAAKEIRGTLISTVDAIFFSLGIFVQILYDALWKSSINRDFDANQMHGTLVLIFGFISFVIILLKVIESPVYFLKRNEEQLALDSLLRLQRPCVMNAEKHAQLQEHKQYIDESSGTTPLFALLKLCILRGIIGLSFTTVVTSSLLFAAISVLFGREMRLDEFGNMEEQLRQAKVNVAVYSWPLIVYGVCRFCGTVFGTALQDTLGRKITLIISMLICGAMAIGIGTSFGDAWDYIFHPWKMTMALVFLFVYQFFTGVCITSSSSYLSEAFPVTAKPYCIAFVLTIEMTMFIIGGSLDSAYNLNTMRPYFSALGGISLAFAVFTIIGLPETKKTTLREALQKFGNLVNISFR